MNDILLKFKDNLKKRKLSENTINAYMRDVEEFLVFIRKLKLSYKEVSKEEINSYSQYLKKEGKANSSITRNLIAIRSFYKFLIIEKKMNINPLNSVQAPKHTRPMPEILTLKEVETLLNTPDKSTVKGKRDKAMLELMYATGMKVNEILNLPVYNVNLRERYIICINSKKKERVIPIGNYAIECLDEFFKVRHLINTKGSSLLFLNTKGEQMTRQGFWKLVKGYAKEANINKHINTSTLRHSFAVHLLQNGANIVVVQELLGHKNMAATQLYASLYKKSKISEEYFKSHPRA